MYRLQLLPNFYINATFHAQKWNFDIQGNLISVNVAK